MPLNKGAKPGSKGFSKNIKAEVNAGKPQKQAVAIAYSTAKDVKGQMHVFVPQASMRNLLGLNALGAVRTVARGTRSINLQQYGIGDKKRMRKDMGKPKFEALKALLEEFFTEEEGEAEHDCTGSKDCGCGCKH